MTKEFDQLIDATGLKCPQPLLLVKKAMNKLKSGQILWLKATDPHTDLDLEVWCERFGHKIVDVINAEDIYHFWLEKAPES